MLDKIRPQSDAVTREVILSGIKAAVAEMDVLIGRAAMSPVIKDKKDYFMGLFDSRGRMIHVLTSYSGPGLVQPILDRFPVEEIEPGDTFFYNDPFSTKGAVGHLPDIVITMPFFSGGEDLLGFSVTFGHLADVGGLTYGSSAMEAKDTFHEGMAFTPMRVGRNGNVDPTFMETLLRNTRSPDLVQGDWRALRAGCQLGVARAEALIRKWGDVAFKDTVEWSLSRSEARIKRIIHDVLADGSYSAVNYADGMSTSLPKLKVGATLKKIGDQMILDLTDSDDQVPAPLNYIASLNGVRLLVQMQLKVLDPEIGNDEGGMQSITELVLREGSVVAPTFPAALSNRAMPRSALINDISDILAEMSAGKMSASSPVHIVCRFAFEDGKTLGETLGPGQGARPFGDGPDVIYGAAQRNYPVEQLEPVYPVQIERYEIRTDSGGVGKFRGGCGAKRALRMMCDGDFSPRLSNTLIPCPGTNGGGPGGLGRVTLYREGGAPQTYPGVYGGIPFKAGDLIVLESSGGGGWGNPLERPVELVLRDVSERFVSADAAWESYGVRIEDGKVTELHPARIASA
ncbi:hydantoinase B/oxoprolinase family protein [Mesorhizobium sp. 1B3]|uniref:hydantoinase B/oxoprolinase family protein n=1 Tax=Mesorhizobium sp. 1B3 TaxID=3243599 RepID=UPI003D98EF77